MTDAVFSIKSSYPHAEVTNGGGEIEPNGAPQFEQRIDFGVELSPWESPQNAFGLRDLGLGTLDDFRDNQGRVVVIKGDGGETTERILHLSDFDHGPRLFTVLYFLPPHQFDELKQESRQGNIPISIKVTLPRVRNSDPVEWDKRHAHDLSVASLEFDYSLNSTIEDKAFLPSNAPRKIVRNMIDLGRVAGALRRDLRIYAAAIIVLLIILFAME